MSSEIKAALRREVIARAQKRCEYCFIPDNVSFSFYPHEPDHIIAIKHNGATTSDNLAYACFDCNRAKGSNIASIDPQTGLLTPLFNPRIQIWSANFRHNGSIIEPLTPEGRVTVFLLKINAAERMSSRANLMMIGLYP
ncbi:MAG: HNH endonuclease [Ktedonobacterales bacterium]|nr:HNH endonuclease [Ktedonobacterales bacterium]